MLRHRQIYVGIASFIGFAMAATAAVAIDRTQDEESPATLTMQQQAPGIDFIITGPAGPSKNVDVRFEANAKVQKDQPVRRRMQID